MTSRFTEHFNDDLFFVHNLQYRESKHSNLTASVSAITAPLQLTETSNSTLTSTTSPILRKRSLCNTFDSLSTFTTSSTFNFFGSSNKNNEKHKRNNSQCTLKRRRRVRNRQFKKSKTGNEALDQQSMTANIMFSLEMQHTNSDFLPSDPIKKTNTLQSKSTTASSTGTPKYTAPSALMNWCLKQKSKFIRLRQSVFV